MAELKSTKRPDASTFFDVYDALRSGIRAAGGMRKVGGALWPHKPAASAAKRMEDCLNTDVPGVDLNPEEFLFVLRQSHEAGYDEPLKYAIAQMTGKEVTL